MYLFHSQLHLCLSVYLVFDVDSSELDFTSLSLETKSMCAYCQN